MVHFKTVEILNLMSCEFYFRKQNWLQLWRDSSRPGSLSPVPYPKCVLGSKEPEIILKCQQLVILKGWCWRSDSSGSSRERDSTELLQLQRDHADAPWGGWAGQTPGWAYCCWRVTHPLCLAEEEPGRTIRIPNITKVRVLQPPLKLLGGIDSWFWWGKWGLVSGILNEDLSFAPLNILASKAPAQAITGFIDRFCSWDQEAWAQMSALSAKNLLAHWPLFLFFFCI